MHRKTRKKQPSPIAMIALLLILIALGFVGYYYFTVKMTSEGLGKIATIKPQEITATGTTKQKKYTWKNNNTGFTLGTMNDQFADMVYAYPKAWSVSKGTANSYRITDPNSYASICVEHTQINWNDEFTGDSTPVQDFKGLFEDKLKNQTVYYNKGTGHRYADQDYKIAKSKATKNNGSKLVICYNYNDIVVEKNDGETEDTGLFERRYYIRNGNNATVMSFLCDSKDKKDVTNLAEYIVSNIKPASESYSSGYIIQNINSKTDVILPKIFKKSGILTAIDGDPKLYKIPETSHSSLAGMFIAVGKTKRKDISPDALAYVFDVAYQDDKDSMDNKYVPFSDSGDFPIASSISKLPVKAASSNATEIIIQKTDLGRNKLMETGDTWYVEQFVLKGDNGKNTYIAIGYPMLKDKQAIKMMQFVLGSKG